MNFETPRSTINTGSTRDDRFYTPRLAAQGSSSSDEWQTPRDANISPRDRNFSLIQDRSYKTSVNNIQSSRYMSTSNTINSYYIPPQK